MPMLAEVVVVVTVTTVLCAAVSGALNWMLGAGPTKFARGASWLAAAHASANFVNLTTPLTIQSIIVAVAPAMVTAMYAYALGASVLRKEADSRGDVAVATNRAMQARLYYYGCVHAVVASFLIWQFGVPYRW